MYFSIVLDDGSDASGTAQLLLFTWNVNHEFDVITELLLSMEAVKDTATGDDMYERLFQQC
jgi:hypothetical protein